MAAKHKRKGFNLADIKTEFKPKKSELNSLEKKWVIILLTFILIILVALTIMNLRIINRIDEKNRASAKLVNGIMNGGQAEEKIENLKMCFEAGSSPEFSDECSQILSDSDIEKICDNLGDYKDQCYYEASISTQFHIDLCSKISKEYMSARCTQERPAYQL